MRPEIARELIAVIQAETNIIDPEGTGPKRVQLGVVVGEPCGGSNRSGGVEVAYPNE